ncbi:MAG: hypothetical protein AAGB13_06980 [Cyanobacteria bacterium P01_F01_bin.33]
MAEAYGRDSEPNSIDAREAIDTLSAFITAIRDGHKAYSSSRSDDVLQELEDYREKCNQALARCLKVRFSAIP